jgi:tetratricopeptide (TPR) repeat protein
MVGDPTTNMPRTGWRPVILAAGLLAAAGGGFWLLIHHTGDRFLEARGPAKWVIYPAAFNPFTSPAAEQTTVFRRSLRVDQQPGAVPLTLRGYRRVSVYLNGETLTSTPPDGKWQQSLEVDLGPHLRPGDNRLEIEVANDLGPPALWLVLVANGERIVSDASWESSRVGATWLPARPAGEPSELRPGNPAAGGERSFDSFSSRLGTIFFFAVLAATALFARGRLVRWLADVAPRVAPRTWALGLVALAWVVLFLVNWQSLTFPVGFDAKLHLDYVRHVQEHGSVPLASEGQEMQQPPVYYLLAAGLLSLCGVTADGGPDCVFLLRAFGFVIGLAGVYFIYRALVRLFPARPALPAAGVLLAACLPVQLYLAHFVSNDLLAGTLGAAAMLMTIVTLQDRVTGFGWLVGLGALFGAGIMTKLTVAPVVAALLAVLALTAIVRDRSVRLMLRTAGVPLVVCGLICGWFFVRNYLHFGRPIVGTHDPISGFRWWQDPGFASTDQFLRFGRVLTDPFHASSAGVPDGLYSTAWGDGETGGDIGLSRPPWNYGLMAAGYLLALIPTALFALGYAAAFIDWVRRPSAVWGLLLVLPPVAAAAIAYHYVSYPFYCHIKAFYALPALLAGCAFVARGFDVLAGLGRADPWMARGLGVALGIWGLTAYFAFFVNPQSADALAWAARQQLDAGHDETAREHAQRALAAEPHHAAALIVLGQVAQRGGQPSVAVERFRKAVEVRPDDRDARVNLGMALSQTRDIKAAIAELTETTRRLPDTPEPYVALAALLDATGDPRGAVEAARAGLRVAPTAAPLHSGLARSLLRLNETAEAVRHYRFALRFDPDHWPALIGLAWVQAAHEDKRFRDGAEAVALATRACELTHRQWPPAIRVLAAALAETGEHEKAVHELEPLLSAPMPQDPTLPAQLQRDLEHYKARKPLREPPASLAAR